MRATTHPAVVAAHLDARDALRIELALRVRPRSGTRGEEEDEAGEEMLERRRVHARGLCGSVMGVMVKAVLTAKSHSRASRALG